MSEREAGGSFDYLWDEPAPGSDVEPERFDAFDINTWTFKPAPVPWYRTKGARIAVIAAAVAAAAIVISVVLLLLRDTSFVVDDDDPTSVAPSATSVAPSATTTAPSPSPSPRVGVPAAPPPPPPPPPPPAQQAPGASVYRPAPPRETKKPEIGVTRTPVTRSPISVAPKPRQRD